MEWAALVLRRQRLHVPTRCRDQCCEISFDVAAAHCLRRLASAHCLRRLASAQQAPAAMRLRCCSADVVDDVVLTEPSDAAVGGQPVSCDHPPVEQESDAPAEDDAPEDSALVTKRWHVYPSHVESDHKAAKAAELLAALRAEPGLDEWRWYFDDAAVLRRFLTAVSYTHLTLPTILLV